MTCSTLILAISLFSLHLGGREHYRGENQGAGLQCNHIELGGYQNSVGRQSYFLGYHGNYIMSGIVTGYRQGPVPYLSMFHDFGPMEILATPLVEKTWRWPTGIVISARWRFKLN